MKQVIVFPRGQLNAKDKERLSKADIVAVEADDPSKVVQLVPVSSLVTGDDLLMAALAGVNAPNYESSSSTMTTTLHKRLKDRETKIEQAKREIGE